MNPKKITLGFLSFMIIISIQSCQQSYDQELGEWRKERLDKLKAPDGWPSVVGLFYLKNTMSYFGKNDSNDLVLPKTAPSSFGRIMKTDSAFYMLPYYSLRVQVNGDTSSDKVRMLSDREVGGPTIASWQSLQWHIIEREDKAYLRVKDTLSAYRTALSSIPYFPVDSDYKVTATFIKADSTERVRYKNVLQMELNDPIAGYLEFTLAGKPYRLIALNNDELSYFVIFADETTGESTYGGGRYLYPLKADDSGTTILDFNKAENPPCVFTPYATCPLPPKENHLPLKITAGEKMIKLY
jgi:uncharacterized protein (DUF1684 family)